MLLDNVELEFYKYEGDYKVHLEGVRDKLNQVAEGWTREQKDHCLQETQKVFQVRAPGSAVLPVRGGGTGGSDTGWSADGGLDHADYCRDPVTSLVVVCNSLRQDSRHTWDWWFP